MTFLYSAVSSTPPVNNSLAFSIFKELSVIKIIILDLCYFNHALGYLSSRKRGFILRVALFKLAEDKKHINRF